MGRWRHYRCKIKNHAVWVIVLAAVLIEVFFCNINSFLVLNRSGYPISKYQLDDLFVGQAQKQGDILTAAGTGHIILELQDIGSRVRTMYLDADLLDAGLVNYSIYWTDEERAEYDVPVNRDFVNGAGRTHYVSCDFNGIVNKIKLDFHVGRGNSISFKEVIINKAFPFQFHIIRVIVIVLVLMVAYGLGNTVFFTEPYIGKTYQKLVMSAVMACIIGILCLFYANSVEKLQFLSKGGDIYNKGLVDALLEGHTDLNYEASDGLRSLENPYDASIREKEKVEYIWDTAYYNGNTYVYYGVIPVLLFYLPAKVLTGQYLETGCLVPVFFSIYVIFMMLIFMKIAGRAMRGLPYGMYLAYECVVGGGSGALWFVTRAKFYEVPYAVGLAFVSIGIYLLVCWELGEKKNVYLVAGALFMALAVGCRPPLLLFSLLLIPFVIRHFVEDKRQFF